MKLYVEDNDVTLKVTDTGQGIGAKTLPNIFRQFRQGDEDSGEKGGLGLGLSISKILIEKHKGKIMAESEGIGQGCNIYSEITINRCGIKMSRKSLWKPNQRKRNYLMAQEF